MTHQTTANTIGRMTVDDFQQTAPTPMPALDCMLMELQSEQEQMYEALGAIHRFSWRLGGADIGDPAVVTNTEKKNPCFAERLAKAIVFQRTLNSRARMILEDLEKLA